MWSGGDARAPLLERGEGVSVVSVTIIAATACASTRAAIHNQPCAAMAVRRSSVHPAKRKEGLARRRVELRLQIKVRRTAHDLSCALVTLLQRKSDHSSGALVLGA